MPTARPSLRELGTVALLALLARLYMWRSLSRSLYGSELTPDEGLYHEWAQLLRDGTAELTFVSDFARLPAHAYAALYAAFGVEPDVIRTFNCALGVAACVLLFQIGNGLGGRATGWVAALFGIALRPLTFLTITLHKSALELALILASAALWSTTWHSARGRQLAGAAAGLCAALAVDVRGNAWTLLFAAPLAAQWLLQSEGGRFSITRLFPKLSSYRETSPPAPPAGPPTYAAYALAAAAGLWLFGGSPAAGFNLYLANNPDNPNPYYSPVRFASTHPAYQSAGFVIEASRRAGHRLSAGDASAYWTGQVLDDAARDPLGTARRLGFKALAALSRFDAANNHQLDFLEAHVPALAAPWLGPGLLLPLFFAGLCCLRRDDRHALWLASMCAAYGITLVIFFSDVRIRLPWLVLMIPIAALGVTRMARAAAQHDHRALRLPFAAAFAALVVTYLPLPAVGDLSSAYKLHALILFERGDLAGAERHYQAATRYSGSGGQAGYLGLAAIAEHRGAYLEAAQHLAHVPADHPQAAEVVHLRARLALRARDVDGALRLYRESLQINSSDLQLHEGLLRLLEALGRHAERDAAMREYRRIASFYPGLAASSPR